MVNINNNINNNNNNLNNVAVNTNNANNADANVNNAGANIVIAMPGNQKRKEKLNHAMRGNEKIIKKGNARLSQKNYN